MQTSYKILLTYKNKILLMNRQNGPIDTENHEWKLIEAIKTAKDNIENSLSKNINFEMGITISEIHLISDYCYHANLTDADVNQIKRDENQLLEFFTIKEVQKLLLSFSTRNAITKHSSLISSTFR